MDPIYSTQSGSPANPAIVFLHGSPLTGRMWTPQLERLTEFFCLAPDLPGHGHSAAIPTRNLASVSEQVARLIRERVPGGRAHVVGLSYGGVIAQSLLKFAPEVVNTTILSGTSNRMARWLVETQRLNEPIMRLLKPEQLAGLVCQQFGIPKAYRQPMAGDFATFSASTMMDVLMTFTEIPTLTENQVPLLVLVGEKETFLAKQAARHLAKTIPHAHGYTVPALGHVWNLQNPDLFTETVRAWVNEKTLPSELRRIV
ncbi:MAG: alpha/beta hydrolase [Anaerolineales bacterium]|nr:alpha/beta hydrolase [Anaerolineales bacterium]